MSPIVVPSFSEALSAPSKSFVLGEYAVLSGLPAVVATFAPRFSLRADRSGTAFHPQSPAGRLLELACKRGIELPAFSFSDPSRGQGGFGASTAEFGLLYARIAQVAGWELSAQAARRLYRELLLDQPQVPSGADLVAQWTGGVVRFDPKSESVSDCRGAALWQDLLVFSATGQPGRKVTTHEHLSVLGSVSSAAWIPRLGGLLERDWVDLGRTLTEYAEVLSDVGLELPAARADRLALGALPGVAGCKGTGALLADGLVLLLEPGTDTRSEVIQVAESRGLRLIADGLGPSWEPGIGTHASVEAR